MTHIPKGPDHLLTAAELAEALNVPLSWVREKTGRNLIPHYKLGKYARYDLTEVMEYFEKKAQPTSPQTAAEFLRRKESGRRS